MDRRVFLLTGVAALAGCTATRGELTVICDPDLAAPLDPALKAWLAREGMSSFNIMKTGPRDMLLMAQEETGLLVVTREARLADRLQRLGHATLQHRWTVDIGAAPAQIVATRGAGEAAGVKFGKWLSSEEAAPYLKPPVKTPVLFSVP